MENSYIANITLSDQTKLNPNNAFKYFEDLLNLIEVRLLDILSKNETKPNVILLTLGDEMYEKCYIVGDYHQKLKKKKPVDPNQLNLFKDLDLFGTINEDDLDPLYLNFRSSLKKLVMNPEIRIPIQILREQTVDPESEFTQNAATKAWNFCTGVYYKCGRHPWILKEVNQDTCFVGISFFHKKDHYNDNLYTSMASLFSNDFDDIVLKGKQVDFDEALGGPYLDYEKSKHIVELSLSAYQKLKPNKLPRRIVIHKTSEFTDDEIKGYSDPLEREGIIYDLVTIKKSSLRFIKYGKMPVPRGSYVSINNASHYLYTKGYVPELQTYPGVHVPAPFEVVKAKGDSSHKELCKEILALTKLNWNTADFCCGLPITIGFSKNVGQVMKHFSDNDPYSPEMSYRFYM